MAKSNLRFIGGILFLVGGAVTTVGAFIFGNSSQSLGGQMTLLGLLLEGAAFIVAALGFRGASRQDWASWLLIVGGGLFVIQALFGFVHVGLSGVALNIYDALAAIAITAGAFGVARSRIGGTQPRAALRVIAVALILDALVTLFIGPWWILAILGLVYVGVGVVFVRNRSAS